MDALERAVREEPGLQSCGNLAMALADTGDPQRARDLFEQALDAEPEALDDPAHPLRRVYATTAGMFAWLLESPAFADPDYAERLYRRVLAAEPDDALCLGNLAMLVHRARRDHAQAKELYERAIAAHPGHATIIAKYANLLKAMGDFEGAEVQIAPEHPDALGNYAVLLHGVRHDYDRAEQLYQRALQADPTHTNNLGNAALLYAEVRKDPQRAEQLYQRAIAIDERHANCLYNYGVLMEGQKDTERARQLYERALAADPRHAYALYNLAVLVEEHERDYDRAEELFGRALEVNPRDPLVLGDYGTFLRVIRKDRARAEEFYRRCLAEEPDNVAVSLHLGNLLSRAPAGADEAERLYQRALEHAPESADALAAYANFLTDARGRHDEAEAHYRRALAREPDNAVVLGNLADLLADVRGDRRRAEELYRRAVAADEANVYNLTNFALFLLAKPDVAGADLQFRRAIEAGPEDCDALVMYANFLAAHRSANDRAEALYQRALKIEPERVETLEAYGTFLRDVRGNDVRGGKLLARAGAAAAPEQKYCATKDTKMVKSYLSYEAERTTGVVVSPGCNVVVDPTGRLAVAGAVEHVVAWQLRTGVRAAQMEGDRARPSPVGVVGVSGDGARAAGGYADGMVRVFELGASALAMALSGHRRAVTALRFSGDGAQLATGSADTDVIVWDLVAEAGLFRLRGHKDAVTDVAFARPPGAARELLVSASKDGLVKLWDLETQHCVQTLVGHRAEVWSLDVSPDGSRLVTGSADAQLRVWALAVREAEAGEDGGVQDDEVATSLGMVARETNSRAMTVRFSADGALLGAQGAGKTVELWRVRSAEEARKKLKRRQKRARERQREEPAAVAAGDELERLGVLSSAHALRSFAFGAGGVLVLATQDNMLEVWALPERAEPQRSLELSMPGHRAAVRALALSPDDMMVLSAGKGEAKVWSVATGECVRTLQTGYAIACAFAGDRHALVGTKQGRLQLFDVGSGVRLLDEQAHAGTLWALDVRPDGRGFATGGADHEVKFWEFEMTGAVLSAAHTRTMKMSTDVLAVRYSRTRNARELLVCVALMDSTVKVFFDDSLRFFLSLYGHKLPVMAMDVSSDNTLLVTASADKNVKLWGLDFGDCHRSLFAHQDSVMGVRFVPNTHFFVTAGKDGAVKFWDGDLYTQVMHLHGHTGEAWALAMASTGNFFVSAGHDRSLRVWRRSQEQVFVEEEQEKEAEAEAEAAELARGVDSGELLAAAGGVESAGAGRRTAETLKLGERLIEALQLADVESAPGRKEAPSVLLMGKSPSRHVLHWLQAVRPQDLHETLLVLEFAHVESLVRRLEALLRAGVHVELCARTLFLVLEFFHDQIASHGAMLDALTALRQLARGRLRELRTRIGVNAAAMRHVLATRPAGADFAFEEGGAEAAEEAAVAEVAAKRARVG